MALTATEEALVRDLIAQEDELLNLAANEPVIISKLGATKVTLSDLAAASSLADPDLLLVRQGTDDKSASGAVLKAFLATIIPPPEFVSGVRMLFAQAAAPVGWTQVTDDGADNRMLRVVKTAGGGIGGSHSPILNNVVPAHTHSYTTGANNLSHGHTANTGTMSVTHAHELPAQVWSNNDSGSPNFKNGLASGTWWDNNLLGRMTFNASADHYHAVATGDQTQNHGHSGATDNGSSNTNWTPRYIDLILCAKD